MEKLYITHYIVTLHWYLIDWCTVECSQYIKDSLFLLFYFI